MRLPFGNIKDRLSEAKIYFTPSGEIRHKDGDIINISDNCRIEPHSAFLGGNNLFSMGSFSYSWSALPINATVGRYCSIARGLRVLGTRHPMEWVSTSSFTYDRNFIIYKDLVSEEQSLFKVKPKPAVEERIKIGNDVWIGADVTIKPGVTIGNGAVIAASSLVVKDVPDYSVIGGNPGKIIKRRFDEKAISMLSDLEWWRYKFTDFAGLDFDAPEIFAEQLKQRISESKISIYSPVAIDLFQTASSDILKF